MIASPCAAGKPLKPPEIFVWLQEQRASGLQVALRPEQASQGTIITEIPAEDQSLPTKPIEDLPAASNAVQSPRVRRHS